MVLSMLLPLILSLPNLCHGDNMYLDVRITTRQYLWNALNTQTCFTKQSIIVTWNGGVTLFCFILLLGGVGVEWDESIWGYIQLFFQLRFQAIQNTTKGFSIFFLFSLCKCRATTASKINLYIWEREKKRRKSFKNVSPGFLWILIFCTPAINTFFLLSRHWDTTSLHFWRLSSQPEGLEL